MTDTQRFRAAGLQEAIATQGRRREWVAAKGGVHPSLITHVLAGRRTVSEDVARRISDALGVPLFFAFELTDGSVLVTRAQEVAIA